MVIGLSGEKHVGKSTAALFLESKGFKKLAFAEPLKNICSSVFNANSIDFRDYNRKDSVIKPIKLTIKNFINLLEYANLRYYPIDEETFKLAISSFINSTNYNRLLNTPREVLQVVGTDIFRDLIDSEYWVKVARSSIPKDSKVVFDDVRFNNEANMIKNLGGSIIRIKRLGLNNNDTHISEQLSIESDYMIVNVDLESFKKDIIAISDLILSNG